MDTISNYIEDKKFIQWVFNPNSELESWWEDFQTDHPKEKKNILAARKVLLKFRTQDKDLTEEEKILIFSRVLKEIEEKQKKSKSTKFIWTLTRYAAVAIIFFSIGALLFYKNDKLNTHYYSQDLAVPFQGNEAQLIRPNGEKILLEGEKSKIEYKEDGQVVVDDLILEPTQSNKKDEVQFNNLIIPFGKMSEVTLPDGSKVTLNAGSRLVYPETFTNKNREVFLVGEAFFEVKKDSKRHFIVQTTDISIEVLGTKFNISAYASDNVYETVLTEGKVRIRQNQSGFFDKEIDLLPNQLATFDRTLRETRIKLVDTENYTFWKEGQLKFESSDLNRVLKKLERFYNIRFTYSDPLLGTLKISGKLELNEDEEEIIDRVASAAEINIIKKGEGYYVIE